MKYSKYPLKDHLLSNIPSDNLDHLRVLSLKPLTVSSKNVKISKIVPLFPANFHVMLEK